MPARADAGVPKPPRRAAPLPSRMCGNPGLRGGLDRPLSGSDGGVGPGSRARGEIRHRRAAKLRKRMTYAVDTDLSPAAERICFHCGEPLPATRIERARIGGIERPMCCAGCKAVAEAIDAAGLDAYYARHDVLRVMLNSEFRIQKSEGRRQKAEGRNVERAGSELCILNYTASASSAIDSASSTTSFFSNSRAMQAL